MLKKIFTTLFFNLNGCGFFTNADVGEACKNNDDCNSILSNTMYCDKEKCAKKLGNGIACTDIVIKLVFNLNESEKKCR